MLRVWGRNLALRSIILKLKTLYPVSVYYNVVNCYLLHKYFMSGYLWGCSRKSCIY